jgi:hypothetical protein
MVPTPQSWFDLAPDVEQMEITVLHYNTSLRADLVLSEKKGLLGSV